MHTVRRANNTPSTHRFEGLKFRDGRREPPSQPDRC
ncbi:hypothetical protein UFOVP181_470 [uncultured Caudovirales phage]|uniref:Uncharacterized protein n=1 Tax=uncultured Caudovirales phage TaxID=2100421 RepID=A0A6J5KX19_9CAUD|nr:hypothetical protein UFOVP57_171 [uncultured Caudovirales phage]CAB5209421.1 hypothetical protein UFOVP181_470 [uncultured Caudovirales phage]